GMKFHGDGMVVSVDRCARRPDVRCGEGRKHAINDRKERMECKILSNLQCLAKRLPLRAAPW
ncbi:MAG: hypothetical protein RR376_19795, partial [Janthinobacterium sp.]